MLDHSTIYKFNFGLDTRRMELTGVAGTLIDATDVFVNQGGELEKRKAFVEAYRLPEPVNNIGTFDLLDTEDGLMVFGSALAYGVTPTQSQPNLDSAMPSGVTYQQLKHPELTFDTGLAYNSNYHLMTDVIFSVNFRGKAFVVAEFNDGRLFAYYDGTLVQHSVNGLVMQNRTSLASLATDLARQFANEGWDYETNVAGDSVLISSITQAAGTATATTLTSHGYTTGDKVEHVGANEKDYVGIFTVTVTGATTYTFTVPTGTATPATAATGKKLLAIKYGVAQNGSVIAKSPSGASFASVITEDSTAGYAGVKNITTNETAIIGTRAESKFSITNCSGTFTLEAPSQASSATPTIDLCGGAVTGLADSAANRILVAKLIADAVNDLTYAHGYTALAASNVVFVYAPVSYNTVTTPFTYNLTVTVTTGTTAVTVATPTSVLSAKALVNPLTSTVKASADTLVAVTGIIVPFGGVGPYTFAWTEVSTGSGNGITILGNSVNSAAVFYKVIAPGFSYSGDFKCTVTESGGTIAIVYITVKLSVTF